ncbi:MAG: peptide chain release factor N(5)-glutamine methyltransferase [Acidobacteria bacterium]|nr:peptide chain release factor N(5)-glutamine methyltransferase [Acidobacteriota bacterium]
MQPAITISEVLKSASRYLRESAVPNDILDAQTLLAEALGRDRTYLIINYHQEVPPDVLEKYRMLIERRASGEPLQYITGHQEFFGLEFEVTTDVLIPRPETEIIIEETIRLARGARLDQQLIIDVGTGSGCIGITLARELEQSRVIATDISHAALMVAKRNARRHGLEDRIGFVVSDLLLALSQPLFADFIISNPPYVSENQMAGLQREVRDWEPRLALTDFGDGLSFYRSLFEQAPGRLKPGGYLICEMGYTQSEKILAMIDPEYWDEPLMLDDLQGIPRTLVVQRRITK